MRFNTGIGTGGFLKSCEKSFKRFVLLWFYILGGIKKGPGSFDPRKIRKVLFITPYKLGDMVISLPVFHNLKKYCPHISIHLLCSKDNHQLVRSDPNISGIYIYLKRPLDDIANLRKMRAENFDCVVDLNFGESVTSVILTSIIAGNGFKLGIGKLRYAGFFDNTIEDNSENDHIININARALHLFGIDFDDCDLRPRLFLSEREQKFGATFVDKLRKKYKMIIGLNLSAGHPYRNWPLEKYFGLVGALLDEYPGSAIVLSYAPSERWKAEQITAVHSESVFPIPQGINIGQVAGILKYLDYLITPETSLYHLASSLDLPSLVMFSRNEKNFKRWRPYNPRIMAIRSSHFSRVEPIQISEVLKSFKILVVKEEARA